MQENKFDNPTKRKRRQVLIKRTEDIVDQAKDGFLNGSHLVVPISGVPNEPYQSKIRNWISLKSEIRKSWKQKNTKKQ